jgi:hypothetical protein
VLLGKEKKKDITPYKLIIIYRLNDVWLCISLGNLHPDGKSFIVNEDIFSIMSSRFTFGIVIPQYSLYQ